MSPSKSVAAWKPTAARLCAGMFALALAIGAGSCGGGGGDGGGGAGGGTGPTPPGQPSTAMSAVSLSSASVASGNSATATLQIKDASGNNLTTTGLSIAFTLGAGTSDGTFGAVTSPSGGVYSATFTGTTSG